MPPLPHSTDPKTNKSGPEVHASYKGIDITVRSSPNVQGAMNPEFPH